jgi:hypothetical protein
MKSLSIGASALIAVVFACQSAQAQYGQCGNCYSPTMCEMLKSGYTANVIWPRQFIPAARRPVHETYAAMVNNGWRRQNLLGDYHFDPETNELTNAGEMKVQWILSQAPIHRRDIYVQRATTGHKTATRIAAVQGFGSQMNPAVGPVNVNDTHIVAEGHSASSVDNMFIGFHANQPPPVLPPPTGSSNEQ